MSDPTDNMTAADPAAAKAAAGAAVLAAMDLNQTMGALLMGVILSAMLYGVTCSQVYFYFSHYRSDPKGTKLLVLAVWLSDSTHQALVIWSIYSYLITNYANPLNLLVPDLGIITELLFNGITGLLVQSFFIMRIWTLSHHKLYLVLPVGALVLAEFGVTLSYLSKAYKITSYLQLGEIRTESILMNVFAATSDMAIAGTLCVILHFSKTSFSRSNTLINKLMIFAINTGLLTGICACLSLITFFTAPDTFIYIIFYYLIGRLYSNSLMATLNARKGLRDGSSSRGELSLSLNNIPPSAGAYNSRVRGNDIAIRIDTTKESARDKTMVDYQSQTQYSQKVPPV
ncbi:uncharacterized protein BXZ73DRAFT_95807 [Epithele typhae]|uniref:uncharacterized protein n=1 Tax=Epithele typhae TaxID=378194 RepID=UPI0020082518|nr:uncharacterized protein BXZ73DRAFT_95807 [Epithele typhae]KAH9946303.1 hypothetical protein BXZ73DRAFT_95807 [Epithele typhae]